MNSFLNFMVLNQSQEQDLRPESSLFESLAWPISVGQIHDSHCNRSHSTLTVEHSFADCKHGKGANSLGRTISPYSIATRFNTSTIDCF